MQQMGEPHSGDNATSLPSGFKYLVGGAALFIAVCSAYFSVRGLGLLFVGSATAVMIMAASLEVGKLVAASFLYRYWHDLNRAMKFYMTSAVVVLIAITSLGNYGYLARAYERTHTQIGLHEQQITALEKEIADTQRQIDDARGQLGKATDTGREDKVQAQARVTEANTALESSLTRTQTQRQTSQDRRDRDIQTLTQRMAEQGDVLKKAMASEDAAIAGLNDRVAVLDRAVDAYTKQGGPGFFKADSVKKGQELRDKQKAERDAITAAIAERQTRQEQLRVDHALAVAAADKEMAAVRDQFVQETARLDAEEQSLRTAAAASLALVEQQLTALDTQGLTVKAGGDTQIEAHYQRIRARNEEIRHLQEQIAATDIGSYRFVARAFEATSDNVVKWLMLALVIVFDPLAVSLAVGFNVALLRDPRRRRPSMTLSAPVAEMAAESRIPTMGGNGRRTVVQTTLLIATIGAIGLGGAGYWGVRTFRNPSPGAHAELIPSDSFAVVKLHPAALRQPGSTQKLEEWLGAEMGRKLSEALVEVTGAGFDARAELYAFAKFPTGRSMEKSDRPVMLCGLVVRVGDPPAAEAALSRMAGQLNSNPSRSRAMIRHGRGRYMDPEGGFVSFGIADRSAVVLLEVEGDPQAPCVEKEMRLCLASPAANAPAREQLLPRPVNGDGAVVLAFDAGRFFSQLPKNPVAQARYQQLQPHLDFNLMLNVLPAAGKQWQLTADYAYHVDRFKDRQQPTALQVLAKLGPAESAGLAGQLMDRCAETLDYDSFIDRLRTAFSGPEHKGTGEVLVEKSYASAREARFVLTASLDPQTAAAPVAAVAAVKP